MFSLKVIGSTVRLSDFPFFSETQEHDIYSGIKAVDFLNSLLFLDAIVSKTHDQLIVALEFRGEDTPIPLILGNKIFYDKEKNVSIYNGLKKILQRSVCADLILSKYTDAEKEYRDSELNTVKNYFDNKKILMIDYSDGSETQGRMLTDVEFINILMKVIPCLKFFDGLSVCRFNHLALMVCDSNLYERGFAKFAFHNSFGTDPEFMNHLFCFENVNAFLWNLKEKVIFLNAPDYYKDETKKIISKAKKNINKVYKRLPVNKIPLGKGVKVVYDY